MRLLEFCSSLVFIFGLFGHWRAASRQQEREDWIAETFKDNTDATWSLHHWRDVASITLPIICLSVCLSIIVQSRDSLHRVAKSGRYLYFEEAILHNSVHKGTELGGWIQSPISVKNFKQAGEAFGVLSYWDIADWEDFTCDSRNCCCVSCIALVSLFKAKAVRRKGWWLLLLSPFLCLPPASDEACGAAVHTVMEMKLQVDVVLLE